MLRKTAMLVGCCWITILSVQFGFGASLRAGVAKVDITPPPNQSLWGYAERVKPASGTLDPLYARVLVLESQGTRLAWVDLDLGRTFGADAISHLRDAVRKSSGISHLLVQATHTHSGPVVLEAYPNGAPNHAWEIATIEKIAKAIAAATGALVDVNIGIGYGQADIGYNRRWINAEGTVSMLWTNLTHLPTSPRDPTVTVLRIDTANGQPLAILVGYACHAVVLGENLQYSADFPGVMTRKVEEAFGGKPLCFYVQGASGDINPYARAVDDDGPQQLEIAGRGIAESAVRVARSIHTEAEPNSTLDVAEDVLSFRLRWNPEKLGHERTGELGPLGSKDDSGDGAPIFRLPVVTLLINKRIALMTMPGEPFVGFQVNWRDRCPAPDALFLGYTNGYFGYFPTIPTAAEGGYGASSDTTWIEVGAGERMVDHAVTRVYEMLGRLKDGPVEPVSKN